MSSFIPPFIKDISEIFVKCFSLSVICDIKEEVFMINGGRRKDEI